ncbi:MAG: PAS domain S-box protein [Bacteroidales bacterium]|nr:PAS domain S-box protein [Bacteroidales bacterium]
MAKKSNTITVERKIRVALKKSEEKYRMLLDLAVDAVFHGDGTGKFITVNDKAVELTGYSKKELLKMNIRDLFPNYAPDSNPLNYDLLSGGITIKTVREIIRKDDKRLLIEMTSKAMPDDTYQSLFRDITESRNAELAALDTALKYRNLHMSMMDGYVFVDMNGKIIDSNSAYQRMLGYNAIELNALTYEDLTPSKWHDFEHNIVDQEILPNGHSGVYQKEYLKKDGTVFPVELRTFLVRNTSGRNEGMWAIVRDITKRKQAEDDLMKSEEKFRSIVESSPTGMLFYQLDNSDNLILTGANPAADNILGISHKTLIGSTILEAFPNLASTGIPELYKKVATGDTGSQYFEIPYEDERFSGYYTVHVFRTGSRTIAVDFSDITRRRQMEEALRHSEIEYRDTLNSMPDWIYVVDEHYKIALVNSALTQELIRQGFKPDCLGMEIGHKFPFITGKAIKTVKLVFSTGNVSVSEQKVDLAGSKHHVEITCAPILKNDKVVKVILMIRDRSKEKEIEELKRRNAEQKEVLLREIHHRVKNNLAIVISLLNFQLRNNTNGELARIIIDIQMRIRSMALIHENLYRSENIDRIPLTNYIDALVYMIINTYSGQHIKLERHLDPMEVCIETALPIGLIVNELLTNSFKYAFPAGGQGVIHIRLKKEDDQMCTLVVEDNGVGLPESISMDSEKSIGLYIVHLLVEQLEGTLKIDRNNGTSFEIRFRNIVRKKKPQLQDSE